MDKKLAVFFAAVISSVLLGCGGPDLKQYESLKEPAINKIQDQKVLACELKGNPNDTSMQGIKAVFKVYYGLKGVPGSVAPRARWPLSLDTPKNEWVGVFAVPVPDSITEIPDQKDAKVNVELKTWKYGEVAEILHIGAYDKEAPTVEKLTAFIKEKGYKIAGAHEEEYLKGPGMFFKGNPDNYYTIIRYPIEKIKVEKAKTKSVKTKTKAKSVKTKKK